MKSEVSGYPTKIINKIGGFLKFDISRSLVLEEIHIDSLDSYFAGKFHHKLVVNVQTM